MSKIKIVALCAALMSVIPAFAQEAQTTPPSTTQEDQMKADKQAREMATNPDVHWTTKGPMEILMYAPFVRPADLWEISHMARTMTAAEERVVMEAISDSIKKNSMAYMQKRNETIAYWQSRSMGTMPGTTTTTTTVTTTTTGTNTQEVAGAMDVGRVLDDQDVYEFMIDQLDRSNEQATFRRAWADMTWGQQSAILNVVKGSARYFNWRTAYGY
jgi:hypothetical protein